VNVLFHMIDYVNDVGEIDYVNDVGEIDYVR